MKPKIYNILFLTLFILVCNLCGLGYSWGPQDETWVRQQEIYRNQTKEAKRIPPEVAFQIFKEGKTVLISVDGSEYYTRNSILGSVNIPIDKLFKSKLKLPKNTTILLYCR